MITNTHLQFLQQKISDIRSALFFSESCDLLKIPVSIVTAFKVDDEGHIWFYINRPSQCVESFTPFPAHLNFFRKGKNYFLKVNGKAFITGESETMRDKSTELLLVKVKIMTAEYFETEPQKKSDFRRSVWARVYDWLLGLDPSYRPYVLVDEELAIA